MSSGSVPLCSIDPSLQKLLREFRFRRDPSSQAVVMKIDRASKTLVLDEVLDDVDTAEELRAELPDHQPRFVVYSFRLEHDDARVSYPMCMLFSTPRDCQTELQMMYAGTKLSLVKQAELTKVFEIRDLDDLTQEWLVGKLK